MSDDELRPQKRGRKIAMTTEERDAFLTEERTCRVATISPDGPHATPLWYLWDGSHLWLYSIVKSQRWADLVRDPRIGDQIYRHRAIELYMSGLRITDQRRFNRPTSERTRNYLPYPNVERNSNSNTPADPVF